MFCLAFEFFRTRDEGYGSEVQAETVNYFIIQRGSQLSVVKLKPNQLLSSQTAQPISNQNQSPSHCLITLNTQLKTTLFIAEQTII